jgi:hypothetical protein
MLFTDRSVWTMIHGIGLGGAALLGLAAAVFYLYAGPAPNGAQASARGGSRALSALTVLTAAILWLTVLTGTYIVVPPYRITLPPGVTDLTQFPRSLILAKPDTAWLHSFAMETKEHMPWIAAMLATAVAFVCVRYRRVRHGHDRAAQRGGHLCRANALWPCGRRVRADDAGGDRVACGLGDAALSLERQRGCLARDLSRDPLADRAWHRVDVSSSLGPVLGRFSCLGDVRIGNDLCWPGA